jgi:hypothetical protein
MADPTFIALNLPNIDFAANIKERADKMFKDTGYTYVGVDGFLHPLIEKLAVKHPEWRFEILNFSSASRDEGQPANIYSSSFAIFYKRERLGEIFKTFNYRVRESSYAISNERITNNMQRGSSTKTTKIDKALKIIEKSFGVASAQETFDKLATNAHRSFGYAREGMGREATNLWTNEKKIFREFVLTHWDQFIDSLPSHDVRKVASLPEKLLKYDVVDKMYNNIDTMYRIVIKDSDYIVVHEGKMLVVSSDELSETVRRNLGMLKLVKDNEVLENIGFRHDETTFFVCGD